jgi:hypothetical protein
MDWTGKNSKVKKLDGGAGKRTPCLSHAKRALYPFVILTLLGGSSPLIFNQRGFVPRKVCL